MSQGFDFGWLFLNCQFLSTLTEGNWSRMWSHLLGNIGAKSSVCWRKFQQLTVFYLFILFILALMLTVRFFATDFYMTWNAWWLIVCNQGYFGVQARCSSSGKYFLTSETRSLNGPWCSKTVPISSSDSRFSFAMHFSGARFLQQHTCAMRFHWTSLFCALVRSVFANSVLWSALIRYTDVKWGAACWLPCCAKQMG